MGMSRSATDALGDRLAASNPPAGSDLDLLDALLRERESALPDVLPRVRESLGGLPGEVTFRVKTAQTLLDKLRRNRTRLSTMQDIAGIRVVVPTMRSGQDLVVAKLLDLWPSSRIEDRRSNPSHGYRAVHVIVDTAPGRVEIQVRTPLQHVWAQVTEQVADRWGRQIRYGGEPTGVTKSEATRRSEELARWKDLSSAIDSFEKSLDLAERSGAVTVRSEQGHTLKPELFEAWLRIGHVARNCGPELYGRFGVELDRVLAMMDPT